jgi:integrase
LRKVVEGRTPYPTYVLAVEVVIMAEIKVYIDVYRGKYRLRLSRTHVKDGRRHFYTGLAATAENYPKAVALVTRLTDQIAKGLTPTLQEPKLGEIWEHYMEYKKPCLEYTTWQNLYWDLFRFISSLPDDSPKTIQQVLSTKPLCRARHLATSIKAASRYALTSGFTKDDRYQTLERTGRRHRPAIDPFSAQERDAIIQAFQNHPQYHTYTPFVKFLFYSGCRIGEVVALHWSQVEPKSIWIDASYNSEYKTRKTTKTAKPRRIPITRQLRDILDSITPIPGNPIVFTHRLDQGYINGLQFSNLWRPIVTDLVTQGLVERYRKPYNTRHTYITMLLEAGLNFAEVSRLSGSSVKTIQEFYFGVTREILVPDL